MSTSWHSAGSSTRKPVMRQSRSSTRSAAKARVLKLARSHPTSRTSRRVTVANVLSGSATRFRTQLSMERLVADRPSRFSSLIVLRAIAISGPRKSSSPLATGGSTGRSGLRRSLNSCLALPRVIGLECNVCQGRGPRAIIRRLGHGCPTRSLLVSPCHATLDRAACCLAHLGERCRSAADGQDRHDAVLRLPASLRPGAAPHLQGRRYHGAVHGLRGRRRSHHGHGGGLDR